MRNDPGETKPRTVIDHNVGLGAHSDFRLPPTHEEQRRSLKGLGLEAPAFIDKAFFEPVKTMPAET